MAEWMIWFGLAGVLLIFEMFTGTFYLLMIGIGFAAGGMTGLAGVNASVQLVVAAIVGMIAVLGLHCTKWGKSARRDVARDPNVNLDIGQTLMIEAWSGSAGEIGRARAMYRGAQWDVELEKGSEARPGLFVIREVRGSRLIVANSGSK